MRKYIPQSMLRKVKTLPFQALSYPFILSEYDNIIIFIMCQILIKEGGRNKKYLLLVI